MQRISLKGDRNVIALTLSAAHHLPSRLLCRGRRVDLRHSNLTRCIGDDTADPVALCRLRASVDFGIRLAAACANAALLAPFYARCTASNADHCVCCCGRFGFEAG